MLERTGDGVKLSVADPTHKVERLQIDLSGRFTGDDCRFDPATGKSLVTFSLPTGGDAGRSVVRRLRTAE